MKKYLLTAVILLTGLLISRPAIAQEEATCEKRQQIEANLLTGINSDNDGLRFSSAYYLGEMKSSKAVIPLMRMLRSEKNEAARIMAALSLIKIENAQGLFLVKRTAQFNDFERVRKMSEHFYNTYLVNKYKEENPVKTEYIADL